MIHERDHRVGKVEKVRKRKIFYPRAKDYCLYLEFVSDVNGR